MSFFWCYRVVVNVIWGSVGNLNDPKGQSSPLIPKIASIILTAAYMVTSLVALVVPYYPSRGSKRLLSLPLLSLVLCYFTLVWGCNKTFRVVRNASSIGDDSYNSKILRRRLYLVFITLVAMLSLRVIDFFLIFVSELESGKSLKTPDRLDYAIYAIEEFLPGTVMLALMWGGRVGGKEPTEGEKRRLLRKTDVLANNQT